MSDIPILTRFNLWMSDINSFCQLLTKAHHYARIYYIQDSPFQISRKSTILSQNSQEVA